MTAAKVLHANLEVTIAKNLASRQGREGRKGGKVYLLRAELAQLLSESVGAVEK